jgi:hypothetical protein
LVRQVPQRELSSPALRAQLASPLEQREPLAQTVLLPQEQHSLAEASQPPPASFARLSPPHPSLLFPP